MTNKHHTRNQPHYSEDEEYYRQNQPLISSNQENNNSNIDQPDLIYQPDLSIHIHETNKHNKQDTTQHHITITSVHKIHKVINQLKCKMKSHYDMINNNMK